MTYFSGITGATSNPAKDFMELVLHPNLVAVGFTYVEETVPTGSQTTRVYKSTAAANGVGDWYLLVNRVSNTSTAIQFGVCEDYDTGSHVMKKWAPDTVTGGQTLPSDRTHYTTAGVVPSSTNLGTNRTVGVVGTAFTYYLSLHVKRVVLVGSTGIVYAGLYESTLTGVSNDFPLVVAGNGTTNNPCTGYTREPGSGTTIATSGGNGTFTNLKGTYAASATFAWVPTASDPSALDAYMLKPTATRMYLPGSESKATVRGVPYGLYRIQGGFAVGDIASIDWAGTTVTGVAISAASYGLVVDQSW